MPSHPNRGARGPASNPTSAEVRAAREAAGHTQQQACATIHGSLRAWEAWEGGQRRMHPGIFAWYLLLTEQHPEFKLVRRI